MIVRKLLAALIAAGVVVGAHAVQAQGTRTFSRTYGEVEGNERGFSILEASDGGYVITGMIADDLAIMKIDAGGNLLWTKRYGGAAFDAGNMIRHDGAGGYIIVGQTGSFDGGEGDAWIIRTDAQGDTLWSRAVGGPGYDFAMGVALIPDGGFIVVGGTESFGAGDRDGYLVRLNGRGDTLWTRTTGGQYLDELFGVASAADGSFITVGGTYSIGGGIGLTDDISVDRFYPDGSRNWGRRYGGSDYDWATTIMTTRDGKYMITGQHDGGNTYLLQLSRSGEQVWNKTYASSGWDEGRSVAETADSGFIIAGRVDATVATNGVLFQDLMLIRVDKDGKHLWTKRFGGELHDEGSSVIATSDGGYVAVGFKGISWDPESFQTTADIYVIKTDSAGMLGTAGLEPAGIASGTALDLYPNPASSAVTVRSADPALRSASVTVTDLLGRTIHAGTLVAGSAELDLGAQPPGLYSVVVRSGAALSVRRLVIAR